MNDPKNNVVDRLGGWLRGGGSRWIVAAGVIGLGLILLSEFWPSSAAKTAPTTAIRTQEYAAALEEQLCTLLRGVEGVGECRVLLTLENGVEYVYATEETVKSDYEGQDAGGKTSQSDNRTDKVILLNGGSEGLLVTEILPTVKGVVVVCDGGEDAAVQERVRAALTTALNITAKRVCVVKGV